MSDYISPGLVRLVSLFVFVAASLLLSVVDYNKYAQIMIIPMLLMLLWVTGELFSLYHGIYDNKRSILRLEENADI